MSDTAPTEPAETPVKPKPASTRQVFHLPMQTGAPLALQVITKADATGWVLLLEGDEGERVWRGEVPAP